MSSTFPVQGIAQRLKRVESADNTALSSVITVSDGNYGIVYRLWVSLDVEDETDLENLGKIIAIDISIGTTIWGVEEHPLIAHDDATNFFREVDLGSWFYDFGPGGFYSGTAGENITVAVQAAGTGIKSRVNYFYSG